MPDFDDLDVPQFGEEISTGVDKEAKEKVEELERLLREIKGTDSFGSVIFNDLCIHPGLKLLAKI